MPTEIKICGLSDPESVDAAIEAGADYVGFVFFPKSPRNIRISQAVPLLRRARGKAAIVALMVDPDDSLVDDVVCTLDPDFLQLHGSEAVDRVEVIRSRTEVPVIKAVGVGSPADIEVGLSYAAVADRLLLDARPPPQAARPGGNGAAFDWALLQGFAPPRPWVLSGGLSPANVGAAIEATAVLAVDVSSGVETAPGKKDPELIRAFVAAVRAAERPHPRALGS